MIIGITGGFGCGKSTVLSLFEEKGAAVYSADRLCHEIYERRDRDFVSKLVDRFGSAVVKEDGSIDRKFIASKVFADQDDMDFLNDIFKDLLRCVIRERIDISKKTHAVTAVEIPLLFEANYQDLADKVLTVYAPLEARKRFLAMRNFDFDEMLRRDAHQMPLEEKVRLADYVIINGSTQEFLREQFNIIWNNITG